MGTILVALDGSPRAPSVLAEAVNLARRLGHRLWLFRAVGLPSELPREAYSVAPDDLGPLLLEHARADLDAISRDVPPALIADRSVELGVAWDSVCRAARRVGADLVVIGAHGYGLVDRVLGTTAAKVVNHADRSVLVVRSAPRPS
jgi:nucleotide-binding universal stress UspA family protein